MFVSWLQIEHVFANGMKLLHLCLVALLSEVGLLRVIELTHGVKHSLVEEPSIKIITSVVNI